MVEHYTANAAMDAGAKQPQLRAAGFVLLSVVVHCLGLWLGAVVQTPDEAPILEFKVPAEVQFGVMDGTGEPAPSEAPPPAPPPKQAPKKKRKKKRRRKKPPVVTQTVENAIGPVMDAGIVTPDVPTEQTADEAVVEGPVRDGKGSDVSGVGVVAGARGEGLGVGAGGHGLGGFAPPGAHIGLHIHVPKVANTSLILEVRSLLNVIPGWEDMVDASGLDPMRDLSHIFIATPDLRPKNLVLSARYRGTGAAVESAVARLAKRRGARAPWGQRGEVRLAPWYGPDRVERVIAMPGDHRLVITRSKDLSRVLSVVRVLQDRQAIRKQRDPRAPAALYRLYKKEAVALSVDDARKFVVGEPPGIPRRARLSVRSVDEFHAGVAVIGQYSSPAAAQASRAYLEGLRTKLLGHSQVKFLGMVSALSSATLKQDGRYLILDVKLTMHQTRYLLDFVGQLMAPRR